MNLATLPIAKDISSAEIRPRFEFSIQELVRFKLQISAMREVTSVLSADVI